MGQKLILVFDDDRRGRKLVRDILEASGYTVVEGVTGKDALTLAKGFKPNLILMDIQMPDVDGVEATRMLKADPETKDITVVALTASVMTTDLDDVMQAGCSGYIPKPIDTRTFIETVGSFMAGKETQSG